MHAKTAKAGAFSGLRAIARRHARRAEEADDLLQSALLAALEAGRTDLTSEEARHWLAGTMRNKAKMEARAAARRCRRDDAWAGQQRENAPPQSSDSGLADALGRLSPALRVTALLALNGCTRAEIGWLLGLSNPALRQRIAQLRKVLAKTSLAQSAGLPEDGQLAYGRIRQALLTATRRVGLLASHDPDGHLFLIAPSQIPNPRQFQ